MLFLAFATVLEQVHLRRNGTNQYLQAFQLRFSEKERYLANELETVSQRLHRQQESEPLEALIRPAAVKLAKDGMILLLYQSDTLRYWSDNSTNFPDRLGKSAFGKHLLFMGNAWYSVHLHADSLNTLVGLLLIKHSYPYENKFLQNNFAPGFRLPKNIELSDSKLKGYQNFIVTGGAGDPRFVLNYKEEMRFDRWEVNYPVALQLLAFGLMLLFLRLRLRLITKPGARVAALSLVLILFTALRALMIHLHWPGSLYALELFDPAHYAASRLLPSLGDFLLNAIGLFFLVYNFARDQFILLPGKWRSGKRGAFLRALMLLLLFVLFLLIERLFSSLVLDSDISFEARSVLELNLYSFAGLLSVALLFSAYVLLADKLLWMVHEQGLRRNFYFPLSLAFLGTLAILFMLPPASGFLVLLFPVLLFILLYHVRRERNLHYNFSVFTALVLLFSLFSVFLIDRVNEEKEIERSKVMAMSLATEHDPTAELMLNGITTKIRSDMGLASRLFADSFNIEKLYEYLRINYFSGYWTKYELQVTVCGERDSLLVQPDNQSAHCISFFDELLRNNGLALSDSGFYYLDNRNSRISYFGRFEFITGTRNLMLNLQLDSRPVNAELGYPELLLDGRIVQKPLLKGLSYAKYYKEILASQVGEFQYSLNGKEFSGEDEFAEKVLGGYRHLIYRVDEHNKLVLSSPLITNYGRVIAFSYIFVFFFILTSLILLVIQPVKLLGGFSGSFRNRIQYSMIGLLMLSLLLVGGGSVYFSIRQYKDKHKELLSEKMQSVYVELLQRFQHAQSLPVTWNSASAGNLEELLRNFSNVFYSDINLFDLQGHLLATSRPEVFQSQLTGTRMNRQAYYQMCVLQKAEYIHPEKIGSLTYLSSYVPFRNAEGRVLAYLNLPYFTKQNVLAGEISNLVVAFVNVYLILILTSISLAVIISRRITHPLRLIQQKIGRVKLGRSYEKISYRAQDELAGLVQEYNRMLEELEVSAEKLARSERETAWREMARQIAHEIKNPLTPMKLSVQHLLRAWDDKAPQFDELIHKLTRTLTEQIDTLSHIASEFSSFATLPRVKTERFNLVDIAHHAHSLFEQTDNLSITLNCGGLSEAWVNCDREELSRALINLVKNGIQAISEGKQGIIRIGLTAKDTFYILSVEDNGAGIPDELREKMFQPNFTTKSAGMGLGLAIVKRIAESAGGRVWFETRTGLGTRFFIEIPAV